MSTLALAIAVLVIIFWGITAQSNQLIQQDRIIAQQQGGTTTGGSPPPGGIKSSPKPGICPSGNASDCKDRYDNLFIKVD